MSAFADEFPILQTMRARGPFAYLDNAATTQKPQCVVRVIEDFYRAHNANAHRGLYELGWQATELFEKAREQVAAYIHAPAARHVIFNSGATAGLNQLAFGLETAVTAADSIAVTELEHHANFLPWQRLARRTGAKLVIIPYDVVMDAAAVGALLKIHGVTLFSLTITSHVLGNRLPVEAIIQEARAQGVRWITLDGTQAVARELIDVQALDCDALVFSGHKTYGPMGIGVLYLGAGLIDHVEPLFLGGGMVDEVTPDHARFHEAPMKFEAGTPNIAGAVGLAEALRFLQSQDLPLLHEQELLLAQKAARLLQQRSDCEILGWAKTPETALGAGSILSFTMRDFHPHDVAQVLADHGVAVRSGHHCAQLLMKKLDTGTRARGTIRISFAPYNSEQDLELFADALNHVEDLRG